VVLYFYSSPQIMTVSSLLFFAQNYKQKSAQRKYLKTYKIVLLQFWAFCFFSTLLFQ
jgi:hypothetical protein